jgi:hypothetical protein
MKRSIVIIAVLIIGLTASCVQEPAIESSADFSTNLQGNTLTTGSDLVVNLENTKGEFITYFDGKSDETTYAPDNYQAEGVDISDMEGDSLTITYSSPDSIKFTVVASSSGNWAEDFNRDVKSVEFIVTEE